MEEEKIKDMINGLMKRAKKAAEEYLKLTQEELFLGIFDSNNEQYYQFLEKKYQKIYQKIPDTQPIEKKAVANKLEWIRKYLQKENRII